MKQYNNELEYRAQHIRQVIVSLSGLIQSLNLPLKIKLEVIEGHENLLEFFNGFEGVLINSD